MPDAIPSPFPPSKASLNRAKYAAQAEAAKLTATATRKARRITAQEKADKRRADHIDGYDRDDIGLSPDF